MFKIISNTKESDKKRNITVEGGGRVDLILADLATACSILLNRAIEDSNGSIDKDTITADFMVTLMGEMSNPKNK